MKILKRLTGIALVLVFSLSFLTIGCTKYASPDDLKKLDEAQKAAISAEKELEQLKKERADLERQVSPKQNEYDDLKAQFDELKTEVPPAGEVKQ